MFEDATFHSRGILDNKTPKWMLLALAFNLTMLAALIVLPLIHPEGLPNQLLSRVIYVPQPQPRAITPAQPQSARPITAITRVPLNSWIPPTSIPTQIPTDPGPPPSSGPIDLSSSAGDVAGAAPSPVFHPIPPPVVKPPAPRLITVSQGVLEGSLISGPTPVYPIIARTTRVSGTVVLLATISTKGAIENLRVLSGNPMLRQAAIDALKTWRYRPYILDNQPVEVETTININFSLEHFR